LENDLKDEETEHIHRDKALIRTNLKMKGFILVVFV